MKNQRNKVLIEQLRKAILDLHRCKSKWLESVPIKESFKDQTVWEGIVEVFELIDHPTAKKCYAWLYDDNETGKRKYIVVLHQDPIDSPEKAVKAAIVQEYRNSKERR